MIFTIRCRNNVHILVIDYRSTIKSNSERLVKIKKKKHLFCKEGRKKKKYKVRLESRYRKQVGKKIMILWI